MFSRSPRLFLLHCHLKYTSFNVAYDFKGQRFRILDSTFIVNFARFRPPDAGLLPGVTWSFRSSSTDYYPVLLDLFYLLGAGLISVFLRVFDYPTLDYYPGFSALISRLLFVIFGEYFLLFLGIVIRIFGAAALFSLDCYLARWADFYSIVFSGLGEF
jgi:hypothetical protein